MPHTRRAGGTPFDAWILHPPMRPKTRYATGGWDESRLETGTGCAAVLLDPNVLTGRRVRTRHATGAARRLILDRFGHRLSAS